MPVLPEVTPIVDVPDIQPEINIEAKKAEENVKPASGSIWNIFRPIKKKVVRPVPKKEVPEEPSFLDGLEAEMDLPPFLKQRR